MSVASLELTSNAYKILSILYSYAGSRGYTFVGRETLSKKTGMSIRTITRVMNELREKHYIYTEFITGQKSTHYIKRPAYKRSDDGEET